MKNLLSKTLLCGVLATSFLLINCQKAPTRGLQAGTGPDANKLSAPPLKTAPCTENEIGKYDAANAAVKELIALTKKENPSPTKEELSAKLLELEAKIKASKDAISALKADDKDGVDACTKPGKDPKNPDLLKVTAFDEDFLGLSKLIEAMGASVPVTDPVTSPVIEVLKNGDRIELEEALVSLYNANDYGCVSNGEVVKAADCAKLKKDSTVCTVKGDDNSVESETKAKIQLNEMKGSSLEMIVWLEVEAGTPRATTIKCEMAEGTTAAKANEVVTRALGKLVKKVAVEAPVIPVNPSSPSGPTQPENPSAPSEPVNPSNPSASPSPAAQARALLPLFPN